MIQELISAVELESLNNFKKEDGCHLGCSAV
jgi:hypothetical protein